MTNLNYWIEETDKVWIKVPSIAADSISTLTIKKEAGYSPDGFNTLDFFDDFEDSLDNWTFSGNANWYLGTQLVYDGTYSAHSGTITHNQITRMIGTFDIQRASTLKFHWRVSSEGNFDYLLYAVDNTNLTRTSGYNSRIDGTPGWAQISHNLNTIKEYSVTFAYAKDGSVDRNNDRGYVDNLFVVPQDKDGVVSTVVSDKGDYYELEITNNTANKLENYLVGVDATNLGTVANDESLKIPGPIISPFPSFRRRTT